MNGFYKNGLLRVLLVSNHVGTFVRQFGFPLSVIRYWLTAFRAGYNCVAV